MILQRQVIKAVGHQIDVEYTAYTKYALTSFHSIAWILISVNVTIYRTVPMPTYQNGNHCIIVMTTELRSSI